MTRKILTGSKQEIAASIAALAGDVREVIVFIDDAPVTPEAAAIVGAGDDWLKGMEPYMVHVGDVDYSREAIYSRDEGE